MRRLLILPLLALVALAIPAHAGQQEGPNTAPKRATGPNTAPKPPIGPNTAIIETRRLSGIELQYPSCAALGAVRSTPLRRGDPGYGRHLDPDGDGVACEGGARSSATSR